jgi:predicted DNA binding CopG/RHH family protein
MPRNFKRKVRDDLLSESDAWDDEKKTFGSRPAPQKVEEAIDQSLGLQMISIRLPVSVITQLKKKASSQGIGYQPYIRQLLTNHVNQSGAENYHTWGAAESVTGLGLEERISLIEERLRELSPAKKGSRQK